MTPALIATLALLASDPTADPGPGPPTLADLGAYRVALAAKADPRAVSVAFRDLWDHPDRFAGRAVRVEGKLARRFRQDRVGEFPALVEAWIVNPAGDPTCLVYPDDPARPGPEVGAEVKFTGTFLRKIRYPGGDRPRLAPLVVGPSCPIATARPIGDLRRPGSAADWTIGLGASALILMLLARRHLARPEPMPRALDPAPRFVDSEDDPTDDGADHVDA